MISLFIEAAVRSLLVGLAVALGLRMFRVRNVVGQKAAWGLVLISALAMPLLLPVTAQWRLVPARVNVVLPAHPMTLLEELQAYIQAKGGSGGRPAALKTPIPPSGASTAQGSPRPEQAQAPAAGEKAARAGRAHRTAEAGHNASLIPDSSTPFSTQSAGYSASPVQKAPPPAPVRHGTVSWGLLALAIYGGIAAVFLVRLVLGLFTTIRLWRTATPVPPDELPYRATAVELRASSKVASPLTIGSAILVPVDYKTWDSKKFRIVLAHERSHIRQGDFYLQLLASLYAAVTWFSPLGWWLKHELAELAEAISDRAGMEEAPSGPAYAQILLEFAAAPRRTSLGVAMARPGSLSRRIERLLNDNSFRQCFAGGRRALVAVALVPLALFAFITLIRVQAAADTQASSAAVATAHTAMVPPTLLTVPQLETLQDVPAIQVVEPGEQALPQVPVAPAAPTVLVEPRIPALEIEIATKVMSMPAIHIAPVITMAGGGMQQGGSLSFDRTLSVSGAAQLVVSTGSGNIHLTRGSGNQIRIQGRIHVNHQGSEDEARQIAANPPIEQSGDMIRVGRQQEQWHGISIDYQIEAPAGTLLAADSGSGDIVDEGVGQNAKLQTGSGDIRASRLEGPFLLKTGSGNIVAEQSGHGDVIAETGSGDIDLKDVNGSFRGQTGSGDIKASGTPSAAWTLQTGSGNIELWTGNAPLTLDASTGSGSVTTEHEMLVQGSLDHQHIRGRLNGGGPTVRAQTGSGDIHMH